MSRFKRISNTLLLSGAGCAWATFPSFAAAQTTPTQASTEQLDSTAAAPVGNDIVVTAQRREQRLQDVGIAITAISDQQLQQTNVVNTQDIVRIVPSLKYNAFSSAGTVFNIRGVSQNDYGDQQEPPVAVYQDDSYASSITLSSFPVFDIARVETLRGPQGTLFGRNATGGAIQFISNQPKSELGGYARVTTGSYGQLVLEGAANAPLTDTLKIRISGQRSTGGNYLKAIEPGVPDNGGQNNYALRGIASWEPTNDFSARLTVRYLRADHERQAGMYSHEVSCPNSMLQGEYLPANVTCPYFAGNGAAGPGTVGTGYRNDSIDPQRGGDPWKVAYTSPSYTNREFIGGTLRLDKQFGDIDLLSITDYQHATKFYTEDTDATPDAGAIFTAGMRLNQYSEELRLSGKSALNQWTVGAFGMIIDGHYYGSYSLPYLNFFPTATWRQKTKSYAIFAQDEYSLTSKLKLIGGLRYWHDERIGFYHGAEASTGVDLTFGHSGIFYSENGILQPSTGITVNPSDADKSYSGLTARAEIDYKPSKDLLIYLSYNRGSKSGGFTFSTATPFPGVEAAFLNGIPYKPETLNSFEGGIKATLAPGTTFNVSAFHYDYQNYQAFAQPTLTQTIINLDATVNGLEAELSTHPLSGLTLSANASLLDTNVKHIPLPDGVTYADHDLPQAPGFSGSALTRYEFTLGPGTASIQGDVQYSSKFCFTLLCAPTEREGAYAVANFRLGYDLGRYNLAVFVNNAFEERYRTYALDNGTTDGFVASIYAKPRIWGITGTVHFGARD